MEDVLSAKIVQELTAPIIEKGFIFTYFYQKGGDSSCVYVYRFQKGKNFLDWREVSGGEDINIVVSVDGEYRFPSLKTLFPKAYRAFKRKHLFKKPSVAERRSFVAACLLAELNSEKADFFGIRF